MKKRYIVLSVIVLLIVGLLTWRLWPQTLSGLLPDDAYDFTDVYAGVMISVFENGSADIVRYLLESENQDSSIAADLLDILKTSEYRPDLRNLTPWTLGVLHSDGSYDGRSLVLSFYLLEEQTYRDFSITFSGPNQVMISSERAYGIYHATNPETLDALVEYIQTHGQEG